MLHYSLWARSCPLASSTVIMLSSANRRAGDGCHGQTASLTHFVCVPVPVQPFFPFTGPLSLQNAVVVGGRHHGSLKDGLCLSNISEHFRNKPDLFLFLMNLVQLRLRQYLQTMGRKRFKNNNTRRALAGNNLISTNSPAALETGK